MVKGIISEISSVVLGKEYQIKLALSCLLAKGHLLIEDIPGIGKTTLAKTLSKVMGIDYNRVQCTNDMLPGDILGVNIFNQNDSSFNFIKGPIFTHLLLVDEINRTTPKTQSSLLEAMEELQVTIEGETYKLEKPFFVIATQNPLEQSGTYSLPESQLDRFLIRISIGYPHPEAEKQILREGNTDHSQKINELVSSILSPEKILEIQDEINEVYVSDSILDYTQSLLEFSRKSDFFYNGLSTRAGKALLQIAKSWAYCSERANVIPEDIQEMLPHVASHRIVSKETRSELKKEELKDIFSQVSLQK